MDRILLITNYRGIAIQFDTERDIFTFSFDEKTRYEKQSYKTCCKKIDDYLKENTNFKSFMIRNKRTNELKKIIGIRKDLKYVVEDNDGKNCQLYDYEEKYYILYDKKDDAVYKEIADINNKIVLLKSESEKLYDSITTQNVSDIIKKDLI